MLRSRATWRHDLVNFSGSASSIVFIVAGIFFRDTRVALGCLGIGALISFFAWLINLRRFRLIGDTPTARVASAAQGYTELYGRAAVFPNEKPIGKRSGLPCVWFRCITYREGDESRQPIADEVSDTSFMLDDGSGTCVIDPDGAEVITTHKRTWSESGYSMVEWSLRPGEPLYAIGELVTEGGASADLNVRNDVSALLAEWKKNKPALLARFDTDKNGEIDLHEWEAARKAAHVEVEKHHHELRLQDGVHILRRPRDGRLFLLSNLSPHQLAKRYAFWAWLHLGLQLVAAALAIYVWTALT